MLSEQLFSVQPKDNRTAANEDSPNNFRMPLPLTTTFSGTAIWHKTTA
jgi:hypothetical protein